MQHDTAASCVAEQHPELAALVAELAARGAEAPDLEFVCEVLSAAETLPDALAEGAEMLGESREALKAIETVWKRSRGPAAAASSHAIARANAPAAAPPAPAPAVPAPAADRRTCLTAEHPELAALVAELAARGAEAPDLEFVCEVLSAAETLPDALAEGAEMLGESREALKAIEAAWKRSRGPAAMPPRERVREEELRGGQATNAQVAAHVHRQFTALGVDDRDLEQYVVNALHARDDELTPEGETLQILTELLSAFGMSRDAVARFVADAPMLSRAARAVR